VAGADLFNASAVAVTRLGEETRRAGMDGAAPVRQDCRDAAYAGASIEGSGTSAAAQDALANAWATAAPLQAVDLVRLAERLPRNH